MIGTHRSTVTGTNAAIKKPCAICLVIVVAAIVRRNEGRIPAAWHAHGQQKETKMPAPKKKSAKAKVKVKDLKAKKNPKGGFGKLKIDAGHKSPNAAHKFSW